MCWGPWAFDGSWAPSGTRWVSGKLQRGPDWAPAGPARVVVPHGYVAATAAHGYVLALMDMWWLQSLIAMVFLNRNVTGRAGAPLQSSLLMTGRTCNKFWTMALAMPVQVQQKAWLHWAA